MMLFAILVAGSFSFGGRIANDIDPLALTAVRFVAASIIVCVLAWSTGGLKRTDFAAPWRFLFLGGLFGTYFVLMFEGLKTAPPVAIAAVFTLTPVMSGLFGWWIMAQRTTPLIAVALTLGSIGALWVIFRGNLGALLSLDIGRGEVVYFIGCAAHALYIPLVPRLNRGEAGLSMAFLTLLSGAIVVGAVGLPRILETNWSALSLNVWAVIIYLTVFASVASVNLIQYASMRLKAAKVMAYTYLVPAWVSVWEVILTGMALPLVLVPGILLTISALLILVREDG